MSTFLGITREPIYSPGKVNDDRAVLEAVADHLRDEGHSVLVFSADDERWPVASPGTTVFTMAQGPRALARLAEWEARGVRVVNRAAGILNCQRHRTVAAFAGSDVAFPETVLVETALDVDLPGWVADGGAWVKRGDVHATDPDDVVFVAEPRTAQQALRRFRERGIARAVVQRHVAGTVLKFYAVRGRFFHCVAPAEGPPIPAAAQRGIDELGRRAAQRLEVEVYGGDCVYGVTGGLTLIDLNDWPSYAPCRVGAAKEIAAYLLAHNTTADT